MGFSSDCAEAYKNPVLSSLVSSNYSYNPRYVNDTKLFDEVFVKTKDKSVDKLWA